MERQYHYLLREFPRLEEFWRVFTVPLTKRLTGQPSIDFRDGVDPVLQYISKANYSLYIHLTAAKRILTNWDQMSLYAIYSRLASAFDVFEALVIKFYLVICECRNLRSPLLTDLSEEKFLEGAKKYYQENYSKLHGLYLSVGKRPPSITIPAKSDIFDEYYAGNPHRKTYQRVSKQEIRRFRNLVSHDVKVGELQRGESEILVPKSSVIGKYAQWSDVAKVADDASMIAKDFCEVKAQCTYEVARTCEILNALYEQLLDDFEEEFYTSERLTLRDLFGIEFNEDSSDVSISSVLDVTQRLSYSTHGSISAPVSGTLGLPPKDII